MKCVRSLYTGCEFEAGPNNVGTVMSSFLEKLEKPALNCA